MVSPCIMDGPTFCVCCFRLATICIGERTLPLKFAGHTSLHLPHTAHAYPSSNCFHVKSWILSAPKASTFSRLGVVRVPGVSKDRKKKLTGAPSRCVCLERGITMENESITSTCSHQPTSCIANAKLSGKLADIKASPTALPIKASAWGPVPFPAT